MSKLAKVKPMKDYIFMPNGKRVPAMRMPLSRYRADQELIRAAESWGVSYDCGVIFVAEERAFWDAISAYHKATKT